MNKNILKIFKEVLERIELSPEEMKKIKEKLENFLEKIKLEIKENSIGTEIFVGGSFAKKTIIKKDKYDIDIFLRFPKEYKDELSSSTKKILSGIKNVLLVHGSRDYFRISKSKDLYFEIIPVLKVNNPKEAENITDLSYSHVKYINKKANPKLLDEIRLAKAFCHANHSYGAESYVHGFSGYSLELLICHYGSFIKFAKAVSKTGAEKLFIDIEKHYKNKQSILMDLNSSKLTSPIILIDPTYKQRNALAALSYETFEKFKKDCIKFIKNPSIKSFEVQKTDLEKIKSNSRKNKNEFILIEAKTEKQKGDIAGSKLLKFYNYLSSEVEKLFLIKNKGFNYSGEKSARYFFVVKRKQEILFDGPNVNDEKNVKEFKKIHKGKIFIKNKRIHAKEKINFGIEMFLEDWKKKNQRRIKEMYVSELKILL